MKAYPDTSFLCALYRFQVNSRTAANYFSALSGPLEVTTLLLFEFRQSVRLQVRLNRNDVTKGFSKEHGAKMLEDLKSDLEKGFVVVRPAAWTQVHATAERLSSKYTESSGHRSMDILHVATAIELGARHFLTFDQNQKKLAQAEGFTVPL